MSEILQQLLNGITLGTVYALVALGFTLIFGVLELIAFGQGGVYMVSAFVGFGVATLLGGGIAVLGVAVLAAAMVGGVLNVTIDRLAFRPLRHASRLAPLISGIGVYMFLENGAGVLFGRQPRAFPDLLPSWSATVYGVHVTGAQLVVIAVAAGCMAALWFLVRRSSMGLMMRAVAERPVAASLVGVEPERVIMVTFMISGAFAGVAAVLVGTYVGIVSPTMGFLIGIKAFAAAVIGGIGNIPGALVGGIAIGIIETFGSGYLSSAWGDAIVFGALIAVLMLKPSGMLGTRIPERA